MSSFEKARALGMLIGQAENDNASTPTVSAAKRSDMFERAKAWDLVFLTERKAKV